MNYLTIDEYIKDNPHYFDVPVNELWIVDNIAIKNTEIKKLLPENFQPKIAQTSDITSLLSEFLYNENKVVLSDFEKLYLIKKIVETYDKPEKPYKFTKYKNSMDELLTNINNIRLNPSYKKRIERISREKEPGVFLAQEVIETLLDKYQEECKKLNAIDEIDIRVLLSEKPELKLSNYDRILIYGNFLTVDEITWKVIQQFSFDNTSEIIFVGTFSKLIEEYFQNKDFIEYQDKIKSFFYSEQEHSLYDNFKSFDQSKIKYHEFSDWDDELNYIANEIKKDIADEIIKPDEVAIFIPKEDLYSFKVEKVLNDFDLPFYTTYSGSLDVHPLGAFIRWLLETDLSLVEDCMKLLKSPFVKPEFNDFIIPKDKTISFNEKDLFSEDLQIIDFNLENLEEVLIKSGVVYLSENNSEKQVSPNVKIQEYFHRKLQYELKRNTDNPEKIENDYQKAYYFLDYFTEKINSIKDLLPMEATPEEFCLKISKLLLNLKTDKRFVNIENEEKPGYYSIPYQKLISVLKELSDSLSKLDDKVFPKKDLKELFIKLAEKTFFSEHNEKQGILITELPLISKLSLKRVYQVGMANSYFPIRTAKTSLSNFMEKFKPFHTREIQLLALSELLNKTKLNSDFSLNLSYPQIINNQEDEPSEIFSDIKFQNKSKDPLKTGEKVLSKSQKLESMANGRLEVSPELKNLLNHISKRTNIDSWSEYEGFLNQKNLEITEKASVTQIEEFAACPMKYFFNQKLYLKKHGKALKDLDSSLKGTLIHKILEEYYTLAQDKDFF